MFRKIKDVAGLFILFVLMSLDVSADGKMYWHEAITPNIPYQRALILFDEGRETLVLQSKFQTDNDTSLNLDIGWVVPCPAVPILSSMPAEAADMMFLEISQITRPRVTSLAPIIITFLFSFFLFVSLFLALLCLLSYVSPRMVTVGNNRRKLANWALVQGIISFLLFLILIPAFIQYRGLHDVEVIRAENVGIYETKIIQAKTSAGLIKWLNENGFKFNDSDKSALDKYVENGWCFVTANIRAEEKDAALSNDGSLVDPIILRFKTDTAIYPLALTSTIGKDTEILIYMISKQKMSCDNRLPLLYADSDLNTFTKAIGYLIISNKEYKDSFWETKLTHISKFKGSMTSAEMKTDLEFKPAGDNEFYQKHVVQW